MSLPKKKKEHQALSAPFFATQGSGGLAGAWRSWDQTFPRLETVPSMQKSPCLSVAVIIGAAPSHAVACGVALPALAAVSASAALSGQSIIQMSDFPYPCEVSPGIWFVHPS